MLNTVDPEPATVNGASWSTKSGATESRRCRWTRAEDHLVRGVHHVLQMRDARSVAEGIARFLKRHLRAQ